MKLKTAMEVKLAYRAVCGEKNQVRNLYLIVPQKDLQIVV